MAIYYFIGPNGQSETAVQPEHLLMNGVTKDTLVWCAGMAQWTKAGDVPELKHLFPQAATTNTVTIHGYTEPFAVNPDVKILMNGVEIAKVSRNGSQVIAITEPCILEFKCSFRTAKCYVQPGQEVILSFNRTTGSLGATVTSKENVAVEMMQKKGSDQNRLVITMIVCAALFGLSMLLFSIS